MKKSRIFATSWMIGFPIIIIFIVVHVVFKASGSLRIISSKTLNKKSPPDCSAEQIQEVIATATAGSPTVNIDCNLNLRSSDVVTKRMIFEGASATGVTVNCNGATLNGDEGTLNYQKDMIEVKSRSYIDGEVRKWERPENITIKNCNIIGSVRIWGMATNGEGNGSEYDDGAGKINYFKESSRTLEHVETARNNAPHNIVLDHVVITGVGRNPLYFAPGVTDSKLLNSEMKGKSDAVAIYLDAESYRNMIKNNYIHTTTASHYFKQDDPLIANDASSYNLIMNNKFSALDHGGIYLYRNCGLNGVIRHSTPSHNKIVNNIFYYNRYAGVRNIYTSTGYVMIGNPSIYLSSRDGNTEASNGWFGYCDDDEGYDFGSSKSDKDYAQYNVVMQNQIYKLSPQLMIEMQSSATPNYINYNQTVTSDIQRRAGCYVTENGYKKDFILDGETIEVLEPGSAPTSHNYKCNDGELTRYTQNSGVTKLSFDCRASGNNNGCSKVISCPAGQKIIGATAACNLEYGPVTDEILGNVPTNNFWVIKASDNVSEGRGYIGNNTLQNGQKAITGIDGLSSISIGCKEHDENGGDCDIKVILYCRVTEIAPRLPVH